VIFSAGFAVILVCLTYCQNNRPVILTGEYSIYYNWIQKLFGKRVDYGDAVYINVYYDRELIPVYREDTQELKGTTIVTNRKKLYKLLCMLHESNQAKYIVLDIGFDPNEVTEYDDSLFNEIRTIDNIVFAHDNTSELPRTWLKDKSALAVYRYTIDNTGFSRYEYTDCNGERYIPTRIYEHFHPSKKIKRYGPWWFSIFFSGNSLCQNSSYLIFDETTLSEYNDTESMNESYVAGTTFYNLGEDFITPVEDSIYTEKEMCEQIGKLTNGKYVVIGNLVQNDNHDTYVGEKPGGLLLMRALQTLEEGGNIVSIWQIMGWALVFFLISIFMDVRFNIRLRVKKCKWFQKYEWMQYLCEIVCLLFSLVPFTMIVIICNIVSYLCFGKVLNMFLPIMFFTIEKLYYQYKINKADEN
jgi:hypothetical protein